MTMRMQSDRTKHKRVAELAHRIKSPLVLAEPFILQDRIAQTRTRHVVVIWDDWDDLDSAARSQVIVDAFNAADVLGEDSVSVAMGITQQEAMQMGYLPYGIVTTRKGTDPVSLEQPRHAMENVGGIHIRTGSSHQLRFPSLDLAKEAYRQLLGVIPGPYWAITQEAIATSEAS